MKGTRQIRYFVCKKFAFFLFLSFAICCLIIERVCVTVFKLAKKTLTLNLLNKQNTYPHLTNNNLIVKSLFIPTKLP